MQRAAASDDPAQADDRKPAALPEGWTVAWDGELQSEVFRNAATGKITTTRPTTEAAGDLVVELVDYCHRKLMLLLNSTPPPRPADQEEMKKQLLKESEDYSKEQEKSINMACAIACLSIVRFMTDHIEDLPLAVTARILDTYDLLMVLCPVQVTSTRSSSQTCC